jgi:hypothetical protein
MKHNVAARRLYERLGFIALGEDERDDHLWRPFTPTAETIATAEYDYQTIKTADTKHKARFGERLRRLFLRSKK